ncbi:hypothetical protein HMPREF0083_03353 [Aneurinibacillus aneurinilyticus ATCC 12856]|uniref:Uncharacterized protein n=1 Tax=Aneurinibacillus aneurinilyticus ATCC 12856 TaxID=649747 RepID=U1X0X0_ANEAE|nr:hypothetical protein HMPREF0083_03353 [Aneurinibacillus aneurinilyticus ATCC 12856]
MFSSPDMFHTITYPHYNKYDTFFNRLAQIYYFQTITIYRLCYLYTSDLINRHWSFFCRSARRIQPLLFSKFSPSNHLNFCYYLKKDGRSHPSTLKS